MSIHNIISAESVINAPIHKVWAVLSDFDKYSEWNEFTPIIDIEKSATNQTPIIGDKVSIQIRWIGSENTFPSRGLKIVNFDEEKKSFSWGATYGSSCILRANRVQALTLIDDNTTQYTSVETFTGVVAPLVMTLHRGDLEAAFDHVAKALKDTSEAAQ